MAAIKDFVILQGKTFEQVIRWEAPPIIYKEITGITKTAPVRITAIGHGAPIGWRVAIVSVKGMTQINAENSPPKDRDYRVATVVDADHIELNDVNASDFSTYVSGGYVQFNTPVPLVGYTARMKIKDKVGGTVLASTEAGDSPANIIVTTIDDVNMSITLMISATNSAALTWKKGVYDLELVSPGGVVTALLTGKVSVTSEVTTS